MLTFYTFLECVLEGDYDRLKEQLCVAEHAGCEKDSARPYTVDHPVLDECDHGDFRVSFNSIKKYVARKDESGTKQVLLFQCTSNSTDRCNWGQWIANPCAVGTKCIGYGDFECIAEGDFERVEQQLIDKENALDAVYGDSSEEAKSAATHISYSAGLLFTVATVPLLFAQIFLQSIAENKTRYRYILIQRILYR